MQWEVKIEQTVKYGMQFQTWHANLEPSQASNTEFFMKIFYGYIFVKRFILDV